MIRDPEHFTNREFIDLPIDGLSQGHHPVVIVEIKLLYP
jgi:hypothetical protein